MMALQGAMGAGGPEEAMMPPEAPAGPTAGGDKESAFAEVEAILAPFQDDPVVLQVLQMLQESTVRPEGEVPMDNEVAEQGLQLP